MQKLRHSNLCPRMTRGFSQSGWGAESEGQNFLHGADAFVWDVGNHPDLIAPRPVAGE